MNTEEKTDKVLNTLNRIPVYIITMFLIFILVSSLLARAEYCGYKYSDNPAWIRQDIFALVLIIILFLCIFILIYKLGEKLNQFRRNYVILSILFLSVFVQVLVILLFPARQFADQDMVNYIAMQIIDGNFAAFQKGGYLYRFPNNVGITLFLSLLYRIYPVPLLLPRLLNIVFSSVTSYLTFRIYEEVEAPKIGKNYAILIFSGFFLPMILLNNLVYNDIYATTLFAGAVFYAIRYIKTKKLLHLLLTGALIITGDFMRQVGTIFLIAIAIYFILKKIRVTRSLAFLGIVLILCRLPLSAVNTYLVNTGKITEPIGLNSIPIYMWINIGINQQKFGYWDDSYSYNIYIDEGGWNKAKSAEIYKALIKKNLHKNGIKGIAKIYLKKNIWLWTEGTYQAEYYGIGSWGYLYPTFATRLFDGNKQLRDTVRWILHSTNLLMLYLSFCGLLRSIKIKCDYPLILPVIAVLGFVGFYTIWEIKPRYIYPVYPYLILMSYYGLTIISERISKLYMSFLKNS